MKKREHEYNIENELLQLTCPDDEMVEKIAEEIPLLDKTAKERILELCERKMDMNMNMNKDNEKEKIKRTIYDNSDTVTGVEKYKKPAWQRPVMSAAASLLIVAGVGGAIALNGNLKSDGPMSEGAVSDEIEATLRSLVEDNFYCLENILYFGNLPYKDVPTTDDQCFEVDSEKFPDYKTLEEYFYSVYSDRIADFYMTGYPLGLGAYTDVDGKLAIRPDTAIDGSQYGINFTEFEIANVNEENGTYNFDVVVDVIVYDKANVNNDSYKTVLEDALIGFEAKTEDDGIRLTGMYGHDTDTRFVDNNLVDGSRGYIDKKWQESYLELIDHLDTIYNSDGEEVNNTSMYFRLIYPEGHDIPLFGVIGGVTDSTVLLYQIFDGNLYIVMNTTPYEELTGTMYSYSEMIQYLEKALDDKSTEPTTEVVTEKITETINSSVSEKDAATLKKLVSDNFYCMEEIFRFGNLPYNPDSPIDDAYYEVTSDKFPEYGSLENYMHSIYTYDIADFYMTQYPLGDGLYSETYGMYENTKFCINPDLIADNEMPDVDFMDFEIANINQKGNIISFDVIVDIKITDTTGTNQTIEDVLIGFEAKTENDSIRLTGMYGHDTLERFADNNFADDTRGYIDAKWEEKYLDIIYNYDDITHNNAADFELFYLSDDDIPLLYMCNGINETYGKIYTIIDGDVYIVKNNDTDMGYFSFDTKDGIHVAYNIGEDFLMADFYEKSGLDITQTDEFIYREKTYTINGKNATEEEVKKFFADFGINIYSKSYTTGEIKAYLENGTSNPPTDKTDATNSTDSTNSEELEDEMYRLFDNNIKCLDIFRNKLLPTKDEPLYKEEGMMIYEVDSPDFASYNELESYIYSVYTNSTAYMYLNNFPYEGDRLYLDYEGKLCVKNPQAAGGRAYYVDFSNYNITLDNSDNATCNFIVTATIQEPGDIPPQEYVITCKAIREDDGWRLEKMYY